ncbi:hypothetical protein [Tatumella citrea]|uniref:hypothetical protein n=1 Tax=Tatumella citrea TaxID=53336 RepID=UPI0012FC0117|nr:hypothetical protein [Tatumella citrea]
MEFHENRSRQPFIGYIQLAKSLRYWWQRRKKHSQVQTENSIPPQAVCLNSDTQK